MKIEKMGIERWGIDSLSPFLCIKNAVMKKNLLLMFLLLAGAATASAQKFALIDMEYILQNIPAYESGMNQLEQDSQKWQAEVEKLGEEAKNMYNAYQSKVSTYTDAQRSKQEEAVIAKEKEAADLRLKYFGPEGELAKKRADLMRPIQDAIYNAVKAIATQRGYALVQDRASAVSIIFASPAIDISDEVLARMGYAN